MNRDGVGFSAWMRLHAYLNQVEYLPHEQCLSILGASVGLPASTWHALDANMRPWQVYYNDLTAFMTMFWLKWPWRDTGEDIYLLSHSEPITGLLACCLVWMRLEATRQRVQPEVMLCRVYPLIMFIEWIRYTAIPETEQHKMRVQYKRSNMHLFDVNECTREFL